MTPTVSLSLQPGCLVVACRGEFDLAALPLLNGLGTQLSPDGPRQLVLNLSEAVIVDCASVRILARLVRAWLDDGRDPVTVCPEGMVAHVLRLTGYTREFEVVPVFLPAVLVEDDPRVRFLLRSAHATA